MTHREDKLFREIVRHTLEKNIGTVRRLLKASGAVEPSVIELDLQTLPMNISIEELLQSKEEWQEQFPEVGGDEIRIRVLIPAGTHSAVFLMVAPGDFSSLHTQKGKCRYIAPK